MKINLLSCDAAKPDKRGIARMLEEIASLGAYDAKEQTDILLEGDPVEIEVDDKSASSAYRSIRKLGIDYELIED